MPDRFSQLPWNDGPAGGTPISSARGPRRWEAGIDEVDNALVTVEEAVAAIQAQLAAMNNADLAGTTAQRQATFPADGRLFYDKDLNKPFWGDGAAWRDAEGTVDTTEGGGGGGGGTPAINGFAAEVVAGGSIGQINLTWPTIADADAITIRETRSPNGVSGMPLAGNATSNSRTPSTSGTYDYWLTYTKDGVESPASNVATVSLPYVEDGGGGGGTPTDSPAEVLNIGPGQTQCHFDVGIGYPDGHVNHNQESIINGFSVIPNFYVKESAAGGGIQVVNFQARADGGTTSINTQQARSELREYKWDAGGSLTLKADWNSSTADTSMSGKSRITHLPTGGTKPWVCFAQIHGGSGDMCRLQVEAPTGDGSHNNLKLVARTHTTSGGSETTVTIQTSYTVGDEINWKIEVINGTGKVYIGGVVKHTWTITQTGCYYKAGAYNQFNTGSKGGYSADSYASVELRDLVVVHN